MWMFLLLLLLFFLPLLPPFFSPLKIYSASVLVFLLSCSQLVKQVFISAACVGVLGFCILQLKSFTTKDKSVLN